MTDYREILRLRGLQYSQRAIARSVRCSRNTVEKVLVASAQLHPAWPLFDDVTNAALERFLFPDKPVLMFAVINIDTSPNQLQCCQIPACG